MTPCQAYIFLFPHPLPCLFPVYLFLYESFLITASVGRVGVQSGAGIAPGRGGPAPAAPSTLSVPSCSPFLVLRLLGSHGTDRLRRSDRRKRGCLSLARRSR